LNYTIKEITDKKTWGAALLNFNDANIYHTWNYALIVQNEKRVKHLAIYDTDIIVGLAQVRYRTDPITKHGIAYIFAGPLWQKKGVPDDYNILSSIFQSLRNELVVKQKYLLRIKPFLFTDQIPDIDFIKNLGFKRTVNPNPYHSIVVYLNKELSDLRKGFKDRWIRYLKKAEKNNLRIVEGTDTELFKIVLSLYEEMHNRKKFKAYVNVHGFAKLQEELSDEFKLKLFVIYKDETPITASITSAIGNTGIGLIGASNELGKKHYGAYLCYWEEIKWLKEKGCLRYDLGGINPEENPNGFYFKSGISEHEIFRVGLFEACESILSKIVVKTADFLFKK